MMIRNKIKYLKANIANPILASIALRNPAIGWIAFTCFFYCLFVLVLSVRGLAQISPLVTSIEAAETAMKPATIGPDQQLLQQAQTHRSNASMAASEGNSAEAMQQNKQAEEKEKEFNDQREDSQLSQNIVQNLQAKKGMAMAMQSSNAAAVNAARQAMASSNPLQMQQNCQGFNSVAKDKSQKESEFHSQVASEHGSNSDKFKSKKWKGELQAPQKVTSGVAAIQASKALHDSGTVEMLKSTAGCGENGMNLGSLADMLGKVAGMAGGGGGKGGGGGGEPSAPPSSSPLSSGPGERVDISNGGTASTIGIGEGAPETLATTATPADTGFNATAPTPISESENGFASNSQAGTGSTSKISSVSGSNSAGGVGGAKGSDGSTSGASQAPGSAVAAASTSETGTEQSSSMGSFGGANSGLLGLTETPLPDFMNAVKPEENGEKSMDFADASGASRGPASTKKEGWRGLNLTMLKESLFFRTSGVIRKSWSQGNVSSR